MRVLFTPYGGGSIAHIVRSLAIADVLRDRGHEILFTTPRTKRDLIERSGYQIFGKGHSEVNLNDESDQSIDYFRTHKDEFIDWLGDEIKAAEAFQPQVIVNSPSFFGPIPSLKLGIPYVSVINSQWLPEFKGVFGLGRSENTLGHRAVRAIGRPIFARQFERTYMKEIANFYSLLGIGVLPRNRMDMHGKHPAIIPGIREFEPLVATKRTDLHFVGPIFWEGFERDILEPAMLFADTSPERPVIYVTLGGSIYRKQSYIDLVKSLAAKTEWNILLSTGPNIARDELPSDSGHLVIRTYMPGLGACALADIVINTGSHGTVMQALWHGKPVIALPHNFDQATNAMRLGELGLGVNMNTLRVSDLSHRETYFKRATQVRWENIIGTTERALGNSSMLGKARAFQDVLRAHGDGAANAASIVERYGASVPVTEDLPNLETAWT